MASVSKTVVKWLFDSTLLGVTKYGDSLFAGLLLDTALVVLNVTCGCICEARVKKGERRIRTADFLLTIASDSTEDGVLLAG